MSEFEISFHDLDRPNKFRKFRFTENAVVPRKGDLVVDDRIEREVKEVTYFFDEIITCVHLVVGNKQNRKE